MYLMHSTNNLELFRGHNTDIVFFQFIKYVGGYVTRRRCLRKSGVQAKKFHTDASFKITYLLVLAHLIIGTDEFDSIHRKETKKDGQHRCRMDRVHISHQKLSGKRPSYLKFQFVLRREEVDYIIVAFCFFIIHSLSPLFVLFNLLE